MEKPRHPYELSFGDDSLAEGYCDADALWRTYHRQATKELLERIEDNILSGWPDDQQIPFDVHRHIGDIIEAELSKLKESDA